MARRKATPTDLPVMEVTETFTLTPAEMEAIKAIRAQKDTPKPSVETQALSDIAKAIATAIESTRPPTKKNVFTRRAGDPWRAKTGEVKPKLKRIWLQHGREINPDQLYPDEIELLNQAKPGTYCKGLVNIYKRKDRSYDITWSVRTSAQRLRVMNEAGTTLAAIVQRCIAEYQDPAKFKGPDDLED